MAWKKLGRSAGLFFFGVATGFSPGMAQTPPSAAFAYDGAGRIATTLYSDQTCVAHKYDSQGNRANLSVTKASTPETSIWGSGVWGCFKWSP